jgi:hypothetical protein
MLFKRYLIPYIYLIYILHISYIYLTHMCAFL